MISHVEAQALISSRLDAPLDPIAERELQAHLATCPTCRAFSVQMSAMTRGFHELPYLPASPTVSRAVIDHIERPVSPLGRITQFGGSGLGPALSTIAAVIVVAVLSVVVLTRMIGSNGDDGDGDTQLLNAPTSVTVEAEVGQVVPTSTAQSEDAGATLVPTDVADQQTEPPVPTAVQKTEAPLVAPTNEGAAPTNPPLPTVVATDPAPPTQEANRADDPAPTSAPDGGDTRGADVPTAEPTEIPTEEPTAVPTDEPTAIPTDEPTVVPTDEPTAVPTDEPTAVPTEIPTDEPTAVPTEIPTDEPTAMPTEIPTEAPTAIPTEIPTEAPTAIPTDEPTAVPTDEPAPTVDASQRIDPADGTFAVVTEEATKETETPDPRIPTDEPTMEPTVAPTETVEGDGTGGEQVIEPIDPESTQTSEVQATVVPTEPSVTSNDPTPTPEDGNGQIIESTGDGNQVGDPTEEPSPESVGGTQETPESIGADLDTSELYGNAGSSSDDRLYLVDGSIVTGQDIDLASDISASGLDLTELQITGDGDVTAVGWIDDAVVLQRHNDAGEIECLVAYADTREIDLANAQLIGVGGVSWSNPGTPYRYQGGLLVPVSGGWLVVSTDSARFVSDPNVGTGPSQVRIFNSLGVVSYLANGQLTIVGLDSESITSIPIGNVVDFDLSPGGNQVVVSTGSEIEMWSIDGTFLARTENSSGMPVGSVLWVDDTIYFMDVSSGEIRTISSSAILP